jgi:hypothetical protein
LKKIALEIAGASLASAKISKHLLRLSFKVRLLSQDRLENDQMLWWDLEAFKDPVDGGQRQLAFHISFNRGMLEKNILADLVIGLVASGGTNMHESVSLADQPTQVHKESQITAGIAS